MTLELRGKNWEGVFVAFWFGIQIEEVNKRFYGEVTEYLEELRDSFSVKFEYGRRCSHCIIRIWRWEGWEEALKAEST